MKRTATLLVALVLGATAAQAADDASCKTVRLSDPSWTDINATNGVAQVVLEALGYAPDIKLLSVPIGYEFDEKQGDRRISGQLDARAGGLHHGSEGGGCDRGSE
ncbi:hypothetical protein [Paenirhodobacter sp.]|uniref:hypothetical protein n=1 Tax=Paenirhodobacter sp. TaxID=1965326 RepID=UPI003B502341